MLILKIILAVLLILAAALLVNTAIRIYFVVNYK